MNNYTLAAGSVTKISGAGNRDFFHIFNNSGSVLYICYDSDDGTAATGGTNPLTAVNGIPIADQSFFQLNNDGNRNVFIKPIYVLSPAGGDVRIQGGN